ncbi:hypothetical protein MPH_01290 [Macrophomina phaseolina MS6]|uniref:Ima1 N-terminal domain-containing protein n=1 Tax=Macrophomina phaseolina (strain MS6) TaxID=1126212 RepID=K2S2V1_MACPH|nr:hypothetical protein MPH_01290 [Macrophomina phaseolina MS6]
MPMLLRRNLTCFYCGAKSELKKSPSIRQFDCKECEATNYLDEVGLAVHFRVFLFDPRRVAEQTDPNALQNGEITDPPVAESVQPARFAQYIPARSPSPNLSAPDRNLFCSTCLKNQHLLTQTLAAYLPPPSDPNYKAFENSYPEYRRNLERRYPPVCNDCAPRVRERIDAAGYAAKTDYLKRLLQRPRRDVDRTYWTGPTWQSILIYWAGWFWWISAAIHFSWSMLGAHAVKGRLGAGRDEMEQALNVATCARQAWRYGEVQADCMTAFSGEMCFALAAMVATFWWNNKLHAKVKGWTGGRLLGLKDHLYVQAVMLVLRAGSYWMLQNPATSRLHMQAYRGAHVFMAFSLLAATIYSSVVVKVDRAPLFPKKTQEEPLVEPPLEESPQKPNPIYNNPSPSKIFQNQSPAYVKPFPINNLAQPLKMPDEPPSPTPSYSTRYTAFTTEATTRRYDDDEDTMEWTPTRPSQTTYYDLRPRNNPIAQRQTQQLQHLLNTSKNEPSPFRGTLPPAPIAPAHKLRNPPNQPTFKKTPLAKQKDFFSRIMGSTAQAASVNHNGNTNINPNDPNKLSLDDDDDDATAMDPQQLARRRIEMEFAEPKFHLKPQDPIDTGLESMFDTVFRIQDEPEEVQRQRAEEREQRKGGWVDQVWDAPTPLWIGRVLGGAVGLPFVVLGLGWAWGWARGTWGGDVDVGVDTRL